MKKTTMFVVLGCAAITAVTAIALVLANKDPDTAVRFIEYVGGGLVVLFLLGAL